MFPKLLFGLAMISVVGAGCSSNQPLSPNVDSMDENATLSKTENSTVLEASGDDSQRDHDRYDHQHEAVMFTVRIENVSTGMTLHLSNGETAPAPHSPGVWTVTRTRNPLFRIGQFDAGLGLERQAEDGNPAMLAASVASLDYVKSSGVFNTPAGDVNPGPATPGKAYEFTISAVQGDRLSFTSMFGQSNDLFYAPGEGGVPLFTEDGDPRSGNITRFIKLWDAGTEVNQEPGLGADQAPRQAAPNTGEMEHNRIQRVRDEYTYPATNEVIKVTIMPASSGV